MQRKGKWLKYQGIYIIIITQLTNGITSIINGIGVIQYTSDFIAVIVSRDIQLIYSTMTQKTVCAFADDVYLKSE